MWDGFNKRKFPRLSLRCEITLYPETPSGPFVTATENVGAGGVCVMLDTALERFSRCRVRLDLGQKTPDLECEGKVVWIVPTKEPKSKTRFDVGIEFEGLEPVQAEQLKHFLQAETGIR